MAMMINWIICPSQSPALALMLCFFLNPFQSAHIPCPQAAGILPYFTPLIGYKKWMTIIFRFMQCFTTKLHMANVDTQNFHIIVKKVWPLTSFQGHVIQYGRQIPFATLILHLKTHVSQSFLGLFQSCFFILFLETSSTLLLTTQSQE